MSIKSLIASDSFIKTKRFNISNTAIPAIPGFVSASILLVAGGGGGSGGTTSSWEGGGGGAGGLIYNSNLPIANTNYTIIVGAGGAGGAGGSSSGSVGSNSTFNGLTAVGGGYGAGYTLTGGSGGSGGGAWNTTGGNNVIGQGNAGGPGNNNNAAGGGGGAGTVGGTGASSLGGAGGAGLYFSISGSNTAYAGGGGGSSSLSTPGSGGVGGGGNGGSSSTAGAANTGGGGGGGVSTGSSAGKAGGSGVVIFNYPAPQQFTGGTVTNVNNLAGSNIVHTFTTSGTMTALSTPIDTYQPYNTLLLHGDGSNGANNSVFLDSSSNTYIPFNGTYSNYFNGSTDYLTTSLFSTTLNTWTMELWIFTTATTAYMNFVHHGNGTNWGSNYYFDLMLNSSSIWLLSGASSGNLNLQGTTVVNDGKWHHISVTYDGSTYRLFIDGILNAYQVLGSLGSSTNAFYIGYDPRNAGRNVTGYISNFRFVDGSVVYPTSSTTTGTVIFNPPVTPLTSITNTVLLTCQSNKFVDNSSLALSITPTGSPTISAGGNAIVKTGTPTQGTFSPFSTTGWSGYFGGSTSDCIYTPSTAGMALGTSGNCTIECWIFSTGTQTNGGYVFNKDGQANYNYPEYCFTFGSSNILNFNLGNSTGASTIANVGNFGTINPGQWYHVAAVRINTTWYLYLNGILTNTGGTAQPTTPVARTAGFYIGNQQGQGGPFAGYVSNLRVSIGTAIYTSNFIPSFSQLSVYDANTVLIACQSNKFIGANSTVANVAFSVGAGAPSVQPFSPFNPSAAYSNTVVGGSLYLNGSTDYLTIPYNSVFDFNSGSSVSFEAWVYPTSYTNPIFLANRNWSYGGSGPTWGFRISNATAIDWAIAGTGSATYELLNPSSLVAPYNIPLYAWSHVVFTRDASGNAKIFVNGYLVAAGNYTSSLSSATGSVYIGIPSSGGNYSQCYISNIRLIANNIPTAYQTSSTTVGALIFTPPTQPFTASTTANTAFLLNATNAGIIDNAQKNELITYGTSAISTTQSKFGGSSMYFDGSSYLFTANPGVQYQFSTGNWTIEMWAYPTSTGTTQTLYQIYGNTNDNLNIQFNGTSLAFFTDIRGTNQTQVTATSSVTATLNAWNHVALVRDSTTTIKLYVNGTLGATATIASTTTFVDTQFTGNPSIGAKTNTVGNYFTGYIDDLRITKGYARYTANFTPPTTAFLNT